MLDIVDLVLDLLGRDLPPILRRLHGARDLVAPELNLSALRLDLKVQRLDDFLSCERALSP